MKRRIALLILAICVIVISGCASYSTSNAYEAQKNKTEKWFEVTSDDLIKEINRRAEADGYTNLEITDYGSTIVYGFEKDERFVKIEVGVGVPDRDKEAGKVKMVELNLYAKDEEMAARNGYYIELLIDIFNPGMVEKIEKNLYIFEDAPQNILDLRATTAGNVRYFFNEANDGYSAFYIMPDDDAAKEVSEKEGIKPIKPSK
ncbi:hypothetical protein [Hydrogenoanaerobacterium sp.]|uniref:hypothetical protein n=1 Tax=Hydrogenoanaerobacterium sp. TaxID=2953763 RepID=UPI00289BAA29|nr:hypothetical protein [Hydrogenoanaerobacterium sp.]